jgi:opacity protein-like surface antigen
MDSRKFAARCTAKLPATLAAVAAVLITAFAAAQTPTTRHETNASRQARIERTIKDTYTHRWEVFGGGGYMRFNSGEYTQKNNEVTWNLAPHYYLNPKLAIVVDTRGMFGNGKPERNQYITYNPNPQINEYAFTGGASYRFYSKLRWALSAEALGGVADGNFSGASKGLTYIQTGFWQDAVRPAFVLNLAGDINIYPNLAFRILPTYVMTTFTSPSGGSIQNNLGFHAGIVYRFGRQQ